ncbi:MAG: tetratricopeptide repeat protein [Hyphomicrobiales bacterium]|nr:tetratricopeptide repeat protein [Hyphomicrobiales bacterium]
MQEVARDPSGPGSWRSRAISLYRLKRFSEALESFDRALALAPDHVETLTNRGAVLHELKRPEEALASFDEALAIDPRHLGALMNRAITLKELGRLDEALSSYERALTVDPANADAISNRGSVLFALNRPEEALASYDRALALAPGHARAWNNRGAVLHELNRTQEALESYGRALAIEPNSATMLFNRGALLMSLYRCEEALVDCEKALAVAPDHPHAFGEAANAAMRVCDWPRTERYGPGLKKHVIDGTSVINPLAFITYFDDAALQLRCSRTYLKDKIPKLPSPIHEGRRRAAAKTRIAYLSADFHGHATSFLMADLFESHDRDRFEVFGISFGLDDGSQTRRRIIKAFDHFRDVRDLDDLEVAKLLSELEIDIAVDLKGYTQHARFGVFAHRPAPIQVSYLGFPGTTGADFIDYVIADEIVLPFDQQPFWSEKIVHLPDCYQANDRNRQIAERTPTRSECGLPERGFVFCSFNNSYKITPVFFDIWMRLLAKVEGSVLWLLRDNSAAERHLRREAASRGIGPERLIFAERLPLAEHLARHRLADLFLDTLPVNAHTTASDALWAGLPVLTCLGKSFVARVAASLLNAVGLPELVTLSLDEYEALALKLAREPALLRGYRKRLEKGRSTAPLFDTDRFRRHLERAYETMLDIHDRGEEPRGFAVQAVASGEVDLDRQVAAHEPNSVARWRARGLSLFRQNRFVEALRSYDEALAMAPDHAETLADRGVVLHQLNRFDEALASLERALAITPRHVQTLYNRAITLGKLKRPADAIASCDQALEIDPSHADGLDHRGSMLLELKRFDEALASYDRALTSNAQHTGAWNNRARALRELNRYDEALASYGRALAIEPNSAMLHFNRGALLLNQQCEADALVDFEAALAARPDYPGAFSAAANAALRICDWPRAAKYTATLKKHVADETSIINPLVFISYFDDPPLQLQCSRTYLRHEFSKVTALVCKERKRRRDKARIAYVSADFHGHATSILMAELFERHDRSSFEVFGISFGPDDKSEMRARLVEAFDHFHDVRDLDDLEVAKLLSELEIDIAVDLKGYTRNTRFGVFAHRPAPIQVSYLGFPGTTGADFIDYVIGDEIVLPFDQQSSWSEKIVHLPGCYQVNDRKREIAERTPTRKECGLPERGFVFCSFNRNFKISPSVFNIWMRLLERTEGSVLWLLRDNDSAEENLRKEAAARGIDPSRLVFARKIAVSEHLARHRLGDLFLDTLPYNAHTTASDALWAGLPVLTCLGNAFAGRVAASLLHAVGLPELVTRDLEEYEALAFKLAHEPSLLRRYRRRLEKNRLTAPLFDTDRFRAHLEQAYLTMLDIERRGEAPRSFSVETIRAKPRARPARTA